MAQGRRAGQRIAVSETRAPFLRCRVRVERLTLPLWIVLLQLFRLRVLRWPRLLRRRQLKLNLRLSRQ